MKPFSPTYAAFGRHETFPLRFGWLSKGYQAWCNDTADRFERDDATVVLGVGKNMVSAIRYWMLAAQIAESQGSFLQKTKLGEMLFSASGYDPFMEDDTTLWLLHWLVASNSSQATTLFWFFNRFHKPEFTSTELTHALVEFCTEEVTTKFAVTTLKNDISLLLRMYEPSQDSKSVALEETLDSPMSLLGLVKRSESGREHLSPAEFRWRLPIAAFGYSVAEVFEHLNETALPVQRFCRSDGLVPAPGSVFRLTDECTIAKLEELATWTPEWFEIRETAGIHQIYKLKPVSPLQLLARHYRRFTKKGAGA
jgi:hypothetical protein